MKHIGLIGGLSPESTIEYYKIISSRYNNIKGGYNFPKITIRSLNLQEIADLQDKGHWDDVADKIIDAINDLKKAGADFAAITSNTPHNAYERINKYSPIEVLSIMDATANEIKKDKVSQAGLLGTKPTMELGFFQETFKKYGIETFIPKKEERDYVNNVIWDELVYGELKKDSKEGYIKIINNLIGGGAEGIILGCTEIPLLIKPKDCPKKTYDTAKIHAKAILDYATDV